MATIRFNVKPSSEKKMQIRAVFQDGKTQKTKNIGETIPTNKVGKNYKYWDTKKQEVRAIESSVRINNVIGKFKSDFAKYIDNCKRDNEKISISSYVDRLGAPVNSENKTTLIGVMDLFLKEIKKTHENSTYKAYKVMKVQVLKYQKENKILYNVNQIDRKWHKEFSQFLMSTEKNTNQTISRKITKIITILKWGIEEQKIKNVNPEYNKKYTLKFTKAAKFPLTAIELETLRAYVPENAYHLLVLESFLLACETGLRYSDIHQLKPSHIHSHVIESGVIRFISLTNIKTDNINNMPLSQQACKVVDKYIKNGDENLFAFHHSQSASKVLKKIFKSCGLIRSCELIKMQGAKTIKEMKPLCDVISFHMARNTYITRLLSANIAPAFVQGNAGHSDLKITMSYFRNDDITRWKATLAILDQPGNDIVYKN